MPDSGVATNIYAPLQAPQQQQLGPLQVLQMIGQLNSNKLFNQEFQSRQAIGDAYKSSQDPVTGQLDTQKLRTLLPSVGYHAPEAVASGIANESAMADRDSKYQQIMRGIAGQWATQANITDDDISRGKAAMAAQGVPGAAIQDFFAKMPSGVTKNGQSARKDFAVTQSNLARGPEATATLTPGNINPQTGVRPLQPAGAVQRQAVTGGGVIPELPIGAKTPMEMGGTMKSAALARASTYGADIFPMEQLLTNLQQLGPQKVGPGTQELNTLKSFVQSNLSWLPGADKVIGNPEDISKYEQAAKYATQLAGSRASMFGHGTDQAMATSLVGSPNTHISQLGSVDLTKAIIGLKRMEQVQALEGANVPEGQYPSWSAKWATNVDPRAFMIDKMDKSQLANVEKTLDTPQKRSRFNMSVKKAINAGVLELPQ